MDITPAITRVSSAQSLEAVGLLGRASLMDKIEGICIARQRNGAQDLSGKEIQQLYEALHGVRLESGTISARIAGLIDAGRLVRRPEQRLCAVTGRNICPVYAPAKQTRLVA